MSGLPEMSHVVCIVFACSMFLILLRRRSIAGILATDLSENTTVCVHVDEDEHISTYFNRHIQFNG